MSDLGKLSASPADEATHSTDPFEQFIENVNLQLITDPTCLPEVRHGIRSYLWQINRILSASMEENSSTPV